MIRIVDLLASLLGLIIASPLMTLICAATYLDTGAPLFYQNRVGRHQRVFKIIKFRTMRIETLSLPTHMIDSKSVTPLGALLRRTKLDELPQLWNVLKGDMSLVGPRPCLVDQYELIEERTQLGVFDVRPGITGLAQIKQINMATPKLLAETDAAMIREMSSIFYFKCIFLTILGRGGGDAINIE